MLATRWQATCSGPRQQEQPCACPCSAAGRVKQLEAEAAEAREQCAEAKSTAAEAVAAAAEAQRSAVDAEQAARESLARATAETDRCVPY